jgi:two-component system, NarL family, sensor histidine kinase UhpB
LRSKPAAKAPQADSPEIPELSRQLLQAQEEERGRISRELHDETGQALMVLRFHLEMLSSETRSGEQKAKIQESLDLLDRTIEGLRRTIARLSPRVLEELGLMAAIRRQAQLLVKHTGIQSHLDLPESIESIDHDLAVALYRSVQEALHNVAKHSRAKNFTVRLTMSKNRISLQVDDDGIGFVPRSSQQKGFGLTGMRERTAALGGTMKLRSQAEKGTRIQIAFQLERGGKLPRDSGSRPMANTTAA